MATLFCTTSAELQAAFDVCVAGDILSLDHTVTFEGNFVVRDRGVIPDNNRIIVQSDTLADMLPADGYRMFPAWSPVLAKIQPLQVTGAQNIPSLTFAAGANGYTFKNLECLPGLFGSGILVAIGANDSATQTEYSHIPSNITFDRVYLHGHELSGQRMGFLDCGDNVRIINSYIKDIKGLGQDTQAIAVLNCRGPLEITNCYLEGAGENFITGGTDPWIRTSATVLASVAPTTTQATLSTITNLSIGQHVAMHYTDGATLRREFATVTAINTTTNRITFTAVAIAPDVPGNMMWGVQFRGLTFRRNHVVKPVRWMTPILDPPVPTTPVVTGAGSGLAAGTYYYVVSAIHDQIAYQQNTYHSAISSEQTVVVAATSTVTVSWPLVENASRYRLYRYEKDGGGNRINARYYVTGTGALTHTDTNAVGTAFTTFPGASNWVAKCLFELKNGIDCQIDSNIMEYQWTSASSTDAAVWLKNNDQNGNQPFSQCEDIVFEKNLLRHIHGFMSISDKRATGELPRDLPDNIKRLTIQQNLVYDSDGAVWTTSGLTTYATIVQGGSKNVLWDHNTILHNAPSRGAIQLSTTVANQGYQDNEIWRNSIYIHESFGAFSSFGQAKLAVDYITNNTGLFQKNIMADGGAAYNTFPATTNYIPTHAALLNEFKNAATDDYRLKRISEGDASDSAYLNLGTDGQDIGCDVNLVLAAVEGVIEGTPEGAPAVPVVTEPRLKYWSRTQSAILR